MFCRCPRRCTGGGSAHTSDTSGWTQHGNDMIVLSGRQQRGKDRKPGSRAIPQILGTVRKRVFLRHLYIKMLILPRQARDKHRESTQKQTRFFRRQGLGCAVMQALASLLCEAGGTELVAGETKKRRRCIFIHLLRVFVMKTG